MIEPKIIQKERMFLVGMEFYGDPFNNAEGWSQENGIGQLWKRYSTYMDDNPNLEVKNHFTSNGAYEVHVEPKEYKETNNFYVFVGNAVSKLEDVPPELVIKVIPPGTYAVFTLKGKKITSNWPDEIYKKWLPNSKYQEAKKITIEFYDDERFKGLGESEIEDSELDIHIPIKPK
jgi:AraC family transcriptional regulator